MAQTRQATGALHPHAIDGREQTPAREPIISLPSRSASRINGPEEKAISRSWTQKPSDAHAHTRRPSSPHYQLPTTLYLPSSSLSIPNSLVRFSVSEFLMGLTALPHSLFAIRDIAPSRSNHSKARQPWHWPGTSMHSSAVPQACFSPGHTNGGHLSMPSIAMRLVRAANRNTGRDPDSEKW